MSCAHGAPRAVQLQSAALSTNAALGTEQSEPRGTGTPEQEVARVPAFSPHSQGPQLCLAKTNEKFAHHLAPANVISL